MHTLATATATTAQTAPRGGHRHARAAPTKVVPGGVSTGGRGPGTGGGAVVAPLVHGTPAPAQAGMFDDLLGTAVPGLLGAASSALSGDSAGALGQVRETGAAGASTLVQGGATALGGLIGGQVGQTVSSLGGAAGQGLGSVISGEASPGQAAGGLLSAAQPAILSLLMSLLQR